MLLGYMANEKQIDLHSGNFVVKEKLYSAWKLFINIDTFTKPENVVCHF
jgi:hypothetical protein